MTDIVILNASTGLGLRTAGAYRTATELRKNGFSVKVVEYCDYITLNGLSLLKDVLGKIISSNTLWIGVSTTWMWKVRDAHSGKEKFYRHDMPNLRLSSLDINSEESIELRNFIKSISPNCKIVCGGSKADIYPDINFYDVYMPGYSEIHAVDFTKWLIGKNLAFQYNIIDDRMVVSYNVKADGFDFANSQIDWSNEYIARGEALPIEVARGCIFKCKFCSFMLNGKKKLDYLRDPDVIYNEIIKNYEMFGVKDYVLSDDTYNDDTEKLQILYDKVWSRLPFNHTFTCYLRLDLLAAHPAQFSLLKDSGLAATFFGIESLNNATNKSIGKGITKGKIIDTLYKCKDIWGEQILTSAGFIIGLPNDTEETCRSWLDEVVSLDFPLDTKIVYPLVIGDKRKLWHSEFEINPEQYGYEIITDDSNNIRWINHKTKMTLEMAQNIAEEYFTKSQTQTPAGFVNTALLGFGFSRDELYTFYRSHEKSAEFRKRFENRRKCYWEKILNE